MARLPIGSAEERYATNAGGHRVRGTTAHALQGRRGMGRPRWVTWALALLALAALVAFLLWELAPGAS